MGILDNIFNNIKNNGINSVQVNNITGDEIPKAGTPIVKNEVNTQQNIDKQQSTATQSSPTPNKWGYSDSDMEYLSKNGYTPDKLESIANFDPTKGSNYLQHLYESTTTKPTEPDAKKMKSARLWAGIADGVGLLSQMWSSGKGAHVRERDYNNSSLSQVAGKEKEAKDRYAKLSKMYEDGLLQARTKDYLKAIDDYNNDRKGVQSILAAKQKIEESARQADQKNQFNYYKLGQDQSNKDADRKIKEDNLKSLDSHRKAMAAQGWARVADSKSRTTAYVKKMSSGSGSNKNYQMIFAANPNDPDAVKDNQLGTNVRVFEMNKGEIDRYAREARADKKWMDSHPELIIKSKGLLGNDTEKLRPNEDIAAAWIAEQYAQRFNAPYVPSSATQPLINWGQRDWQPNNPLDIDYVEEAYGNEDEEDEEFPTLGSIANF